MGGGKYLPATFSAASAAATRSARIGESSSSSTAATASLDRNRTKIEPLSAIPTANSGAPLATLSPFSSSSSSLSSAPLPSPSSPPLVRAIDLHDDASDAFAPMSPVPAPFSICGRSLGYTNTSLALLVLCGVWICAVGCFTALTVCCMVDTTAPLRDRAAFACFTALLWTAFACMRTVVLHSSYRRLVGTACALRICAVACTLLIATVGGALSGSARSIFAAAAFDTAILAAAYADGLVGRHARQIRPCKLDEEYASYVRGLCSRAAVAWRVKSVAFDDDAATPSSSACVEWLRGASRSKPLFPSLPRTATASLAIQIAAPSAATEATPGRRKRELFRLVLSGNGDDGVEAALTCDIRHLETAAGRAALAQVVANAHRGRDRLGLAALAVESLPSKRRLQLLDVADAVNRATASEDPTFDYWSAGVAILRLRPEAIAGPGDAHRLLRAVVDRLY